MVLDVRNGGANQRWFEDEQRRRQEHKTRMAAQAEKRAEREALERRHARIHGFEQPGIMFADPPSTEETRLRRLARWLRFTRLPDPRRF